MFLEFIFLRTILT